MAELYSQSYAQRSSSQYHSLPPSANNVVYLGTLVSTHSSHGHAHGGHSHSASPNDDDDPETPPKSADTSPTEPKPPQKTQSTFLTKLYAYVLSSDS